MLQAKVKLLKLQKFKDTQLFAYLLKGTSLNTEDNEHQKQLLSLLIKLNNQSCSLRPLLKKSQNLQSLYME